MKAQLIAQKELAAALEANDVVMLRAAHEFAQELDIRHLTTALAVADRLHVLDAERRAAQRAAFEASVIKKDDAHFCCSNAL